MTMETKIDTIKDKENSKKKDEKAKEKQVPITKVVLRQLPPSMTAETLLEQLSPVPDYDYFYFCPADKSLGRGAFCRAYVNFINEEDLFVFTEKFDNYVFLDENGGEFPAMVEYAPYQKVPKKRPKKSDTRKGTLEKDPDYLKFLESYENPQKPQNTFTPESILEEIENREKELKANHGCLKMSTPLLDFVRKKREEKKQARDKFRDERKKRDDERRKKKDDDRKRKKDRDRDRQMEKERDRRREKEKNREKEEGKDSKGGKGEPLKMLIKQNEEKSKGRRVSEDAANSEVSDKKYGNKDVRPKMAAKDTRSKDRGEKDSERWERDRKRREKEDEEERKWRERERERREKREKERKDREKKERERRDKERERKDRERKQREVDKVGQRPTEEQTVKSERSSKIDIRSILKVEVMKDSTSSLDEQQSGSENLERSNRDAQRSKARYKDRPERQMYNPGQRAAERRKQMEAKKEVTPEPRDDQGHKGEVHKRSFQGQRRDKGRHGDRAGEGYEDTTKTAAAQDSNVKGVRKTSSQTVSRQKGGSSDGEGGTES